MTLIKSLLLGSAAGIVAVASAQAADLPTKKAAPVAEYVRICTINVGGKPVVGFVLPGSDTCLKFSGYVTAQIEGGPVGTRYALDYSPGVHTQYVAPPYNKDEFGFTTRLNFTGDAVSNTAAGPLAAHFEMQFENGSGFDNTGISAYINKAYVTWAGITAGKAESFFSFTGGGAGWANFISPDQKGFNQPDLLAYTASFGGGFSASIAIQDPDANANGGGSTGVENLTQIVDPSPNYTYNNNRWPDIVGQIRVSQAWGSAQVSGVLHDVDVTSYSGVSTQITGWGIDAGVAFNLPQWGAADQFLVTGSYTENAIWYSGILDAMWYGQGNDSEGQAMAEGDTYYNGTGWETPSAWSITAELDHTFSPEVSASIEGSYAGVSWSNSTAASVVSDSQTWLVGGVIHYDPVKNLDFAFELLYQDTHSDTPNTFKASGTPFHNDGDGTAARMIITRSW